MGILKKYILYLIIALFSSVFCIAVHAEPQYAEPQAVVVDGEELFVFDGYYGAFTPKERAQNAENNIIAVAKDDQNADETFALSQLSSGFAVMCGNKMLFAVSRADAERAGKSVEMLAEERMQKARESVYLYRERRMLERRLLNIGLFVLVSMLAVAMFGAINYLFRWGQAFLHRSAEKVALYQKKALFSFLPSAEKANVFGGMAWIFVIWVLRICLLYAYFLLSFSIFPATKIYAVHLLNYVWLPLSGVLSAAVAVIPNIVTIVVIIIFSIFLTKIVRYLFTHLRIGTIKVKGFYSEWAEPTYNILRFVIIIFTFVAVFPYIPGSDAEVFKTTSVMLGILLSFGSSAATSNIVAGIALIYTKAFRLGDRVQIGEHVGDVIERSLFETKIRTIKNVEVAIPNAQILSSPVINYNSIVHEKPKSGLILNTTVTIGYSVDWREVQRLLIAAALRTEDIMSEPIPFVLQTALNDYYVSYEINAYTRNPQAMAQIYSDLHANIQDAFNVAGVEIMSPSYTGLRDGNAVHIPDQYVSKERQAKRIRVDISGK